MAFCRRGNSPIQPICSTNLHCVPGNKYTKYHQDFFTHVNACTGRRADSYSEYISSGHPYHSYMYMFISIYIIRLVLGATKTVRWTKLINSLLQHVARIKNSADEAKQGAGLKPGHLLVWWKLRLWGEPFCPGVTRHFFYKICYLVGMLLLLLYSMRCCGNLKFC